jgi:hypothetical protein
MRVVRLVAFAALVGAVAPQVHAYDWLQFGGNSQHSNNNTLETIITRANVSTLAQKYQVTLPAVVDGTPMFLQGITTPLGVKDLLFATTRDGRILALDSANGSTLWSHQYGPGSCLINGSGGSCFTTSSPAIDPNRQFVYSYGLDGFVHKYQVGDGTEIVTGGWPQLTTVKGFDEKGSGSLSTATAGGVTYLYVVHGGYPGDNGDYQGHVTAINLGTGAQKVFNAACSDVAAHLQHRGGATPPTCISAQNAMWSRPGVIYDAGTNRIFMGTGNSFPGTSGQFDGARNWSESVIALNPDATGGTGIYAGKPLDSYTPTNWASLDNADADVGSTAPAILPVPANSNVQHLAVQGGKDSMLRLINLANMSGHGAPGFTGGEVGVPIGLPQGDVILSQPAVWINPADNSTWVFVVNRNGAAGFRLNVDGAGNPSLAAQWHNGMNGTSPVVANGMLFYLSGTLVRALDPLNGNQLWSIDRGTGNGTHWQSAIVANGVVYAMDQSAHLAAFGVTGSPGPTTTTLVAAPNPANAGANVAFTATVTGTAPTGNVAFTEAGVALTGCSAVALSGGGNSPTAVCNIASLSVGTHSIVASYGGDGGNLGSASAPIGETIDTASGGINVALASNGGVASASSTYSASFPVSSINNGDRTGAIWGSGGGWNDATGNVYPDWVQVNFSGQKTIDRVILYTLQDNYASPIEPPDALMFAQYGVTDFQVQGWNGSAWVNLGSAVSGNNLVKRAVTFAAFNTDRVRVNITGAMLSYSRVVELEAWGTAPVGPPPTTTTLTSLPNPSTVNGNVAFTATVSGAAPTGNVAFTESGVALAGCASIALAGGGNAPTAVCNISTLSVGTHNVVASYAGDAGNAPSSSAPLAQVVNSSGGQINVALASNGGVASASSTFSASFPASSINNGDRAGLGWGSGGGWNDATGNAYPDWVQINFSGQKTIDHVIVYTLQDNYQSPVDPPDTLTFTQYGVTAFQVQGWNGSAWVNLGGAVSGNNLVKRTVNFSAFTTDRIRVNITGAMASYSRIVEVEAWGVPAAQVNVALAANGGVASASTTFSASFPVSSINNGDRAGIGWGSGGGWNDATGNAYPDWVQINFSGQKTIDHVIVYTLQDNYQNPVDPPDTLTFTQYGVTDFWVQGWNGSTWVNLGAGVAGNNLVKRTVTFPPMATDRIRVNISAALAGYSRITEIEAWGN